MTMTDDVRSYLERTIPERRREQIAGDEGALRLTVELVAQQCDISEDLAQREIKAYLTSHGTRQVEIHLRDSQDGSELDAAIKAHDYRQIRNEARQRLIDGIIDYQIAMREVAGEAPMVSRNERMQMLRLAESLVDDLEVPDPEFLKGRDAREDADLTSLKAKFLVALENAPDGLTRVGISDATSTNYGKWRGYRDRVLNHLVHTEEVIRVGTEKRGRYYLANSIPDDVVREDDRVREVYETIHAEGPVSRSGLMKIIGNDSISGRRVVQNILDRLVGDHYLKTSDSVRGFTIYEVA
jgi:hypothetical protein